MKHRTANRPRGGRRRTRGVWLALVPCLLVRADAPAPNPYQTQFYTIHHDLTLDGLREVVVRTNCMVREYQVRCAAFGATLRERLPFYLFTRYADYLAAGGPEGSAGVFKGNRLMAHVGAQLTPASWSVIQHEGFHQFAHAVIGGDLPMWVNEGLAEYFGEGIFTGDRLITGIVPPDRLARLKEAIAAEGLPGIEAVMKLSNAEWNDQLKGENYDMAWSMVHFLAHGDNGKYDRPFNQFLRAVNRGTPWEQAWLSSFGKGTAAFESRWKAYWIEQPDNPSRPLYEQALVETLTGYVARAATRQQRFKTAEEFFAAARSGSLQHHAEDWLPASLLEGALRNADSLGHWTINAPGTGQAGLTCTLRDGTVMTGTFKLSKGRVASVRVTIKPAPAQKAAPNRG